MAQLISTATGRTVIDRTGLKGQYMVPVFDLLRAGVARQMSSLLAARGIEGGPESDVDVYGLIRKFGLKLEARKLPTTVLVIDRIEKTPTEN